MSVSGVGPSDANYPSIPPTNGTPAYSFVMISRLSEISGSLAASAAAATSVAGAGSSEVSQLYAEMQALTDLAKIHLYLSMNPPDTKDALAAANDFMKLKSQCDMTDPNISSVYQEAASYFTIDSKTGQVTGFQNDSKGNSFSTWWSLGSAANSGIAGAQYEMDWLEHLPPNILNPCVSSSAYTPAVFVDLCLMYADGMTIPSIRKAGADKLFWGNQAGGPFTFAQIFPYAMAAYAYQMTFIDPNGNKSWASFYDMMSQTQRLLTAALSQLTGDPSNYPNFASTISESQALMEQLIQTPTWPPKSPVSGIDPNSLQWKILQGTLSSTDLSNFYGSVLDAMFQNFEYNSGL